MQDALGSGYRRLDLPLKVEWPDGRRAAVLFVVEEETEPRNFSIHRLAHYCLDLADLLKTTRVVPVVVFLRRGGFARSLNLGDDREEYLSFRFIACELARLPAEDYFDSGNIVARLNLPNMAHPKEQRLRVYDHAVKGLAGLETDRHKQGKYLDFIDAYADLSEDEVARYRAEYYDDEGGKTMGLAAVLREEGREEGRQEGEAAILLKLMALKFGPLPAAVEERVRRADAETLLAWSGRVLTAAVPEEIVGD